MATKVRIALILQGSKDWLGGAEYSKNLLKALYRLPAERQATFELLYFGFGADISLFHDMPERFGRELHPYVLRAPWLWQRVVRRVAQGLIDTTQAAHHTFLRCVQRLGIQFLYPYCPVRVAWLPFRTAAWIPDFQHKFYPQFFTAEELKEREERFALVARSSSCVVLSSQSAQEDFARFYPAAARKSFVLRFPTVVEESWFESDPTALVKSRGLPERFFMVANQFWQHKNHRAVFEALGILRTKGIRPILVCTGNPCDYRRPGYQQEYRALIAQLGIADQVLLLGIIPRREQVQLMRQAVAVVQPSLFEGWSTVVEDARALGKKLALSSIAVHREQNPPGAVFFEPDRPEELALHLGGWWQHLPRGPNPEQEMSARQHNRRMVADYAERFLSLAQRGLALSA